MLNFYTDKERLLADIDCLIDSRGRVRRAINVNLVPRAFLLVKATKGKTLGTRLHNSG